MKFRYWLLLRPAMPGTIPKKNLHRIENYDYRKFDDAAGRNVWGYVVYTAPLSGKEIVEYELMEGGTVDD